MHIILVGIFLWLGAWSDAPLFLAEPWVNLHLYYSGLVLSLRLSLFCLALLMSTCTVTIVDCWYAPIQCFNVSIRRIYRLSVFVDIHTLHTRKNKALIVHLLKSTIRCRVVNRNQQFQGSTGPSFFLGGAMNKPVLIMLGIGVIFLLVIILIAVLDLSTRKLHK